jgi:hypothetical protein
MERRKVMFPTPVYKEGKLIGLFYNSPKDHNGIRIQGYKDIINNKSYKRMQVSNAWS